MPIKPEGKAPYGPVTTVLQVLERYRERGLQTPFTTEVLARAGVSESLTRRTLQTLKLLELVDDDGNPASALEDYSRASTEDARTRLAQVVREVYAPVFAFADPAVDPLDRIRDAFRGFEPRGQQERMVALFIGLCEHVGLAPETSKGPTAPRPARPRSQKPAAAAPSGRSGKGSKPDAARQAGTLPDAVEGMVRELASIGPTWTRARRDEFMTVWNAVIAFSYPAHEHEHEHEPGASNGDGSGP